MHHQTVAGKTIYQASVAEATGKAATHALSVLQVLHDPTIDKPARKARAKALKQMGSIFRNCKPQLSSAEAVSHKDRLQNVRRTLTMLCTPGPWLFDITMLSCAHEVLYAFVKDVQQFHSLTSGLRFEQAAQLVMEKRMAEEDAREATN